jgi:hypothetical protein
MAGKTVTRAELSEAVDQKLGLSPLDAVGSIHLVKKPGQISIRSEPPNNAIAEKALLDDEQHNPFLNAERARDLSRRPRL